jgi:phosphatidylglycerol---prolipoprotein diacylglyceryl transferase
MKQILGTLTVGPLLALFALVIALFWGWRIVGDYDFESTTKRFKAMVSGTFSLGFFTIWSGSEKPDLLSPGIVAALSFFILVSGSSWDIPIFGYGFSLMCAFMSAIALACARAKRQGIDPNHLIDIGMLAVGFGVLGARTFYYIQFYTEKFADRPWWKFFAVWEGGIVYYGGLILGAIACIIYISRRGYRIWQVADVTAPTLAIGLSFGRVGCFLNGCCWGQICSPDFPLAIQFPRESFAWWRHVEDHASAADLTAFQDGQISRETFLAGVPPDLHDWSLFVHPTQFYSWCAAIFLGLLLFAYDRYLAKREGQGLSLFFMLYAISRFTLEMFRGDHHVIFDWNVWALTPSQSVGVWVFPVGLAMFIYFSIKGDLKQPDAVSQAAAS